MRKIREILRLKWDCALSNREIAKSCALGRATVAEYLRRAQAAGLTWPLPPDLDEAQLERWLFPAPPERSRQERLEPDWVGVHRELKGQGVTLFLLWQEYKAQHPEGYQYSGFCHHYRAWLGRQDRVMRS